MSCVHDYIMAPYCGVLMCGDCGDHKGLERCYKCEWSRYGRTELIMGETIDARVGMTRAFWLVVVSVALLLTPLVLPVGAIAGLLVIGCEHWLILVGKLGAKVGWWKR